MPHLEAWDGDLTTDRWDKLVRDEFDEPKDGLAARDILDRQEDRIPIHYDFNDNNAYDHGEEGIILGDTAGDFSVLDEGELFVPLDVAQEVVCASNQLINSDQRVKLMRHAIAAQLNVYNGAAGAEEVMPAAVDWLTGELEYPDVAKGRNK